MDKRRQFGQRYLEDADDVFKHNAWDDVEWSAEQIAEARKKVEDAAKNALSEEQREHYEREAAHYWDEFYGVHGNGFFKDRHWLFVEFPELLPTNDRMMNAEEFTILEIGSGVGNTVFPFLEANRLPNVRMIASDFSSKAIDVLKKHPKYEADRCVAIVLDTTAERWDVPFPPDSLDLIISIFVLSAIAPEKHEHVVKQMFRYLKPGGMVLFRDYGRYDMAQLRFKAGRCLGKNFYVRGDGTRCFFFEQEELRSLFLGAGFVEESNMVDKRLQVNRGKRLSMYRVWIMAKYRKPIV